MTTKKTKWVALAACLMMTSPVRAHDEGHGPKLTDTGSYGGVVTAVVAAKDAGLGAQAPLIHKAELVRSEDGTVRVYLYDKDMKPLDIATFDKSAKANLIAMTGGKESVLPFDLQLEGSSFIGKAPQAPAKPFNIDVVMKAKDQELLSAFDNLD
jgi:hypothetical protein